MTVRNDAAHSPFQVIHPLLGEFLTTGAIASVTWAATEGLDKEGGSRAQGVELWLIDATGGIGAEELIAEGVDADCMVSQEHDVCMLSMV